MTLLELAADVREKTTSYEQDIHNLKQGGGDWTSFQLAKSEALKIAEDGLRSAWTMLDRLGHIAREQTKGG